MSHDHLDYAALLQERGLIVTFQRRLILDALCESEGHTTADEICTRVQAKAPEIDRATVYRTLNLLFDLQLVVVTDIGDKRTVYEVIGDTPHHHLVCRKCGQMEQISHEVLQVSFAEIERERQFKVVCNHLVLFGLCQHCCRADEQSSH